MYCVTVFWLSTMRCSFEGGWMVKSSLLLKLSNWSPRVSPGLVTAHQWTFAFALFTLDNIIITWSPHPNFDTPKKFNFQQPNKEDMGACWLR